jgi:hypothetical protein
VLPNQAYLEAPKKTSFTMETVAIKEIQSQHFEHTVWMNQLKFYADEVKIYELQLEKLVGKNIREMLPRLEHFQNNFIRQKEVLDTLMHEIKLHEHQLANAISNDQELSEASQISHEKYREEVEVFQKIYNELKADFLKFWRKWH